MQYYKSSDNAVKTADGIKRDCAKAGKTVNNGVYAEIVFAVDHDVTPRVGDNVSAEKDSDVLGYQVKGKEGRLLVGTTDVDEYIKWYTEKDASENGMAIAVQRPDGLWFVLLTRDEWIERVRETKKTKRVWHPDVTADGEPCMRLLPPCKGLWEKLLGNVL